MARRKSDDSESGNMVGRTLHFQLGTGDRLTLSDLRHAIQRIAGLLADLDAAAANSSQGALRWRVTLLEKRSPAKLAVTAEPVKRRDPVTGQIRRRDTSPQVEQALIGGVRTLDSGERPEQSRIPDAAIEKIARLANQARRMGDIQVSSDLGNVSISETTLAGIHKVIGSATRSKGSILGRLDTIAVHHANEIRVWDENSDRAVRCRYPDDLEAQVKELLRQRVLVYGMVAYNVRGQAVSVAVERLSPYEEAASLPTIEQLSGLLKRSPDESFSLAEYMEHLRDER